MKLSDTTKQQILDILDSKEFMSTLYEGLDEDKRNSLGQVYTPGKVCIKMIESFDCETLTNRNILDPTCGSGNLLIACLIAGADADKLYGNDYDPEVVPLCVRRINRACDILGKPHISNWQIHQGNALDKFSLTYFGPDYVEKLEEHFYEVNRGEYVFSFFEELTKEQEKALKAAKQAIESQLDISKKLKG
jgi:2-polyprenyl-3-methyl-5-hydroxy-6-metoxy-1,4-benzoquinol methylase